MWEKLEFKGFRAKIIIIKIDILILQKEIADTPKMFIA